MKLIAITLLLATNLAAQIPAARVASDANVVDRVAEASTNDLPRDLLKRIVANAGLPFAPGEGRFGQLFPP